jgi:hypothetical protein
VIHLNLSFILETPDIAETKACWIGLHRSELGGIVFASGDGVYPAEILLGGGSTAGYISLEQDKHDSNEEGSLT